MQLKLQKLTKKSQKEIESRDNELMIRQEQIEQQIKELSAVRSELASTSFRLKNTENANIAADKLIKQQDMDIKAIKREMKLAIKEFETEKARE